MGMMWFYVWIRQKSRTVEKGSSQRWRDDKNVPITKVKTASPPFSHSSTKRHIA
jgi:hypothetical protein